MKKKSLKFKLIVGGILAVVVPLSIVGIFSISKSSDTVVDITENQAFQIASNLATMVDLAVEQEVKLARNMALEPLVVTAAQRTFSLGAGSAEQDLKTLDRFFGKVFKEIGSGYDLMFIADHNGRITADSMDGQMRKNGVSIADRDYFMSARSGSVSIGTPVLSKASGKPVFVVAVPLASDTGQFCGILGTVVQLDSLSEKITRVKVGETGYPFMIDKTGNTIAHPNKEFILELNLASLEGMESITTKMMAAKSGVENYVFKGIHKIAAFAPVTATGWSIGMTQNRAEFMAPVYMIRNVVLITGGLFLAVTLAAVLWFARQITLPINRIIEGLKEGSSQVAAASTQVSSSSQSLAEGASQQAASIEETSSSMEEMASMTRKNAENARQADALMKEANQVVTEANTSMGQLIGSMDSITRASEETSHIIKTIDEIAFQTNLLALNAAVEAARAGEAGAGFAVVADEVRNLAMRAADAAKSTAKLIKDTITKVKEGSDLVTTTNDAFGNVARSAGKVGDLVSEISEASSEQSSGIEQVNIAVSEMDKVVQQNAANAEESASASEEMNAQAEQLRAFVQDLVTVVAGGSAHTGHPAPAGVLAGPRRRTAAPAIPHKRIQRSRSGEIRPDQVIPFDDDQTFEDF